MTRTTGARSIAFVGAGPRTLGIVERLASRLRQQTSGEAIELHVIDPHPPGGGRIWRDAQSPLLWMNSEAQDVTVFTDESVQCEGPLDPGPSLAEWAQWTRPTSAGGELTGPRAFAPRVLQARYLSWAWERATARLPDRVTVHHHATRATALVDSTADSLADSSGSAQRIELATGSSVEADLVVLAQGYLEQAPGIEEQRLLDAADEAGLTYLPSGHTADIDLSGLRPGEPVLVRGMGLAFVDLVVLLGEGRGGRFSGDGAALTYHPSGKEPVLHVGSRRGVPYHAKLGYEIRDSGSGPAPLRHLTRERLGSLGDGRSALDYRTQVWPLVVLELAVAHYRRLFEAHPERTRGTVEDLERALTVTDVTGSGLVDAAAPHLLDPTDVFDIALIDRPLAPLVSGSTPADEVEARVVEHVEHDLRRRADPARSSDRAVFDTLLGVYAALADLVVTGRLLDEDRVRRVEGDFHGLFSFLASGPPPRRLAELLALHRAGVVRFVGPDLTLGVEDGRFVARSGHRVVRARAAVEARLPRPDSALVNDPLVAGLLATGELRSRPVVAADGTPLGSGQLVADARGRAVRADGSVHPRRFLLGPAVSGSAGAGGFSRPGFGGPGLRQNDAVAADLLRTPLARSGDAGHLRAVAPPSRTTTSTTTRTTTRTTPPRDKDHRRVS
ncbi:FAD-NAD(P)-binding protein [Humibacillus xanthopallidus]|uniref:FAD-NAD(P)-binding protein n=1 Tax=Humibacillus xanthopallidus TaxID=412689 RepID=A0A543PVL4_9MICO|nr:FAD/NAD(P)-binding protein [Humibacillus xanthopallidus]TQN48101.1 FAD-NAD(P)-binding protein [Humibacillus xanthopallidus]